MEILVYRPSEQKILENVPVEQLPELLQDQSLVICVTGNGLKTVEAVRERIGAPVTIKASLASFEERVLNARA